MDAPPARRRTLRGLAIINCSIAACLPGVLGCGRTVSGTEADPGAWIRLVEPADGDSVAGWIDLVAEVDLGELVHRVTFFVDDAPIVVATQTPWVTDWLPPVAQTGKVVRFRAEAAGAKHHVVSPTVAVWIAPRTGAGSRIIGPYRSIWVERSPQMFLEMRGCGTNAWAASTRWSGQGLRREFRSERLPVAMLPSGLQRVRAVRPGQRIESWVHPFDYPGSGSPLAASESLALALRARDVEGVASLLSPAARLESCGPPVKVTFQGDELSAALRRFLVDPAMADLSWSWRLASIGEWTRGGRTVALVRANNFRWSFGRISDPCEDAALGWIENRPGATCDLTWSRTAEGGWTLETWIDRVPANDPAFVDQLRPG